MPNSLSMECRYPTYPGVADVISTSRVIHGRYSTSSPDWTALQRMHKVDGHPSRDRDVQFRYSSFGICIKSKIVHNRLVDQIATDQADGSGSTSDQYVRPSPFKSVLVDVVRSKICEAIRLVPQATETFYLTPLHKAPAYTKPMYDNMRRLLPSQANGAGGFFCNRIISLSWLTRPVDRFGIHSVHALPITGR